MVESGMNWVERIIAAHAATGGSVSRYKRLRSSRYFVWAEDGRNDLAAGNIHAETAVTGTTDLYTKIEDDPLAEALERAFDEREISWYKTSVQYEDDTGYIHHEWAWEVL